MRARLLEPMICLALALCIAGPSLPAEIDYHTPERVIEFADYLKTEKDYLRAAGEYKRYLVITEMRTSPDSVLASIGTCYRLGNEPDKAISYFQRVLKEYPQSEQADSAAFQIALIHYDSGRFEESLRSIDQYPARSEDYAKKQTWLRAADYMNLKQWEKARSLVSVGPESGDKAATELRRIAEDGASIKRKSPFVAGLMSAIVPGSGKMYAGRFRDGLYSLVSVAVMARAASTTIKEDGGSTRSWIYGALATGFYLGNVYGSVAAANSHNRSIEAELMGRIGVVVKWSFD